MSTHLHVRSAYTLLNSTLRIEDIVRYAKQYGYTSVALCDKQVMHGAMSFYHAAKKAGIKPIFGMEVMCSNETQDSFGFIFLAKDDEGYQNLLALSTLYNTQKAQPSLDELQPYAKHCVVITNGDRSSLEAALIKEDKEEIIRLLTILKEQFQDFYVSIACNDSGLLKIKNLILKECAEALSLPTTALSRI